MRRGKVVGSLPDGFSSPKSRAASARPNSWPGYQVCSTAGTRSSHGIATGLPGVEHDDRPGVGRRHRLDQLVLAARQRRASRRS